MHDPTTTESMALFQTALVGNNYSPETVRTYIDNVGHFLIYSGFHLNIGRPCMRSTSPTRKTFG
jgi:hypothetical protein